MEDIEDIIKDFYSPIYEYLDFVDEGIGIIVRNEDDYETNPDMKYIVGVVTKRNNDVIGFIDQTRENAKELNLPIKYINEDSTFNQVIDMGDSLQEVLLTVYVKTKVK